MALFIKTSPTKQHMIYKELRLFLVLKQWLHPINGIKNVIADTNNLHMWTTSESDSFLDVYPALIYHHVCVFF